VRHRGDVDDLGNLDTCIVDCPDCGLTSCSGTLDIAFYFAETCVESGLGSILSGHLGSIGSILLGTAETALSC
jgi:hypothetical protein